MFHEIDKLVRTMHLSIQNNGIKAIHAGNNGPYYDVETNVRNLAHWCVTFSEYYLNTLNKAYQDTVILLADELMESEYYNGHGVYKSRLSDQKDEVNGVIGTAWIIEGLVYAYKVTDDVKYYERALLVFLSIPFNWKLGLWNRLSFEGKVLSVDSTFNHQLWLAASGALINNSKYSAEVKKRVDVFVKKIPSNITIRSNGRIAHFTRSDKYPFGNGLILTYRNIMSNIQEKNQRSSLAYKENGYHMFNLYGFASLAQNYKDNIPFVNSNLFKKSLQYIFTPDYDDWNYNTSRKYDATNVNSKLDLQINVFSVPYNAPGFEICRVKDAFFDKICFQQDMVDGFISKQFKYTYNQDSGEFNNNTDDKYTLNARIYELIAENKAYWSEINSYD